MAGLQISPTLSLSLDIVTKTVAVLAQRRKGKTYTASVMAEEMVGAGMPFVVLDPTGAWWGLRSGRDGKSVGLPVVVLGGQHGDIPLDRTAGKAIAELVIDQPGWYVIDFSLFESGAAERQFATDFAERLYRRKGQPNADFPLHLFVDEADRFVPQVARGGRGEARETDSRMLGAFEAIVRRGGLRGLGTTLISQRSAVVNKNVLEQCDMLILLRIVGPNDRKRIDEYLQADADTDQRRVLLGSLASLDIGEAWLWEPGGDPPLFDRVRIRERNTFNSSATPKPGQKRVEPSVFASVDLTVIKEAMAETISRAEADDPKALRRRIADLERQLRERPAVEPVTVEVERVVEQRVEVVNPQAVEALRALRAGLVESLDSIVGLVEQLPVGAATAARIAPPTARPSSPRPISASVDAPQAARPPSRPTLPASSSLPGPQRKLLTVLATYGPRSQRQLAMQAGYSENGGGFRNPLGALRSAGFIEPRKGEPMSITAEGLAALGDFEPLPTGRALLDHWLSSPSVTGPMARILSAVVERWPDTYEHNDLAAATGYDPQGGGFRNPLGALRTLSLVTRGSPIGLTEEFAEAVGL